MKNGFKFVISVALLAATVGCGPEPDPSKENNGATNNGATNNGATNNGATNNGTPTNNGTTTNNGTPTNNGTTTNNGTPINNGTPGVCEVNTVFFGQIGGDGDHGGGVPSTDALTNDAGIGAILVEFSAMEMATQTVDLPVTGAIVTATNFGTGGNSNFWIQDANGAMQVFLGFDNPVADTVKIGDAVSFTVTALGNFSGHPQITAITGYTVDSSGNPVPYADKTGVALTAADYNTIVRIGGTLGDVGTACGGSSMCYELTHGDQTLIYRSSSSFTEPGDCLTYVGPLSSFPGPNNDAGTVGDWQLDVKNFDWSWTSFE